jgi:hypothetical protein
MSSETRRQLEADQDLEDLEEDARQDALARAADPGPTRDAWIHVRQGQRGTLAEEDEEDGA